MQSVHNEFALTTEAGLSTYDITDPVVDAVAASSVREGVACVFAPHSTCCIRVACARHDVVDAFTSVMREIAPRSQYYAHDDLSRRTENLGLDATYPNGHAHCMTMLLGPNGETIPIRDGQLCLGPQQRLLFIEFDRPRERRWILRIVGT